MNPTLDFYNEYVKMTQNFFELMKIQLINEKAYSNVLAWLYEAGFDTFCIPQDVVDRVEQSEERVFIETEMFPREDGGIWINLTKHVAEEE